VINIVDVVQNHQGRHFLPPLTACTPPEGRIAAEVIDLADNGPVGRSRLDVLRRIARTGPEREPG
jgi:hypothetical protein